MYDGVGGGVCLGVVQQLADKCVGFGNWDEEAADEESDGSGRVADVAKDHVAQLVGSRRGLKGARGWMAATGTGAGVGQLTHEGWFAIAIVETGERNRVVGHVEWL